MILDFSGGKLEFFKALYREAEDAMAAEIELMKRRFDQYNGSTEIDGSATPATQVRNITYELIECQVTSYIPTPIVTPLLAGEKTERNAKSIETLLRAKRNELPFERYNDLDERFAPIYSGSVWLVEWDESVKTHSTVGDVRVTCLPPTSFVGQPNVYEIEDMEYCFIRFETTKEEIVRKYGVPLAVAKETESDEPDHDDGYTATLYVCYYRDADGRVCQYAWSGETELLDLDDYYARRRRVCRVCGEREGLCRCEKPAYHTVTAGCEELTHPVVCSDGTVIPATSPVIENGRVVTRQEQHQAKDAEGHMLFNTAGGFAMPAVVNEPVPVTEPTRIPYYVPKVFPIVIRKNTSKEKALFGQSDCDVIRPQQQAINKIESRIMQKLLRASVTPVLPDDTTVQTDNSVFGQVIRLAPGQSASQYGVVDTSPDISQDIAQSERLYDQAKRIIGISDSFQGQYDASAQSGKAKQLQIQQAAGRLDSKRRMKNAAYADIDRVIFSFYLAYADEPRPAVLVDADGRRHNVTFDRYDFLERDAAGQYYYEDRYLFECDAAVDIEDNRPALWEENLKNFQMGTYGNPQDPTTRLIYWRNMERAHYPHARENVDGIEAEAARQQKMAAMQAEMQTAKAEADALRGDIANRERYEAFLRGERQ